MEPRRARAPRDRPRAPGLSRAVWESTGYGEREKEAQSKKNLVTNAVPDGAAATWSAGREGGGQDTTTRWRRAARSGRWVAAAGLEALRLAGLGVEDQCDDQAVQTQHLGENENENHADEQPGLLGGGARGETQARPRQRTSPRGAAASAYLRRAAHTRVADNADGEAGRQTGEADRETGAHVDEAAATAAAHSGTHARTCA